MREHKLSNIHSEKLVKLYMAGSFKQGKFEGMLRNNFKQKLNINLKAYKERNKVA